MSHCSSFLLLLGRICISIIFINSGVGKFLNPEGTATYMASKGFIMVPFFLYGAVILEVVGGLSLFFGFFTRWGALLLIIFLVPTTVLFHDFWNLAPPDQRMQMIQFLKNLAIFGGLLYTMALGAGKYSIDQCCGKCTKQC